MIKQTLVAVGICSIAILASAASPGAPKLVGWFACEKCTAARAAKGDFRPSHPDCARRCIEEGSAAVFLDEEGKQSLKVQNYAAVKDDFGYHVEVTGRIDAASKTIAVESVTKLGEGAFCSRPKK